MGRKQKSGTFVKLRKISRIAKVPPAWPSEKSLG